MPRTQPGPGGERDAATELRELERLREEERITAQAYRRLRERIRDEAI